MAIYSDYLNVLLISEQTLKTYTLISDNIDGKYILPAIRMSQDIDLEAAIGTSLVNALKYLVSKNLIPSNDVLEPVFSFATTLLDDFITPYLAWETLSNIQIGLNYKFTNSGMIGNDDERKSRIDYNKAQLLTEQYRRYADAYGQKLRNFVCDNSSKVKSIIDYVESKVGSDSPLNLNECPKPTPICGIYFGKARSYDIFRY